MAASVASPPRSVHIATAAGDPRDSYHVLAILSVDPDDAIVLARSEHFAELADVEKHAHTLRRALSLRHGRMVDVQILNAAGWPVGGA